MFISTRSALLVGIAVAGAIPVSAQEAVLLRLDPPAGQLTHQRLEGKTWMLSGTAVPSDTSQPTMTTTMYSTQTVAAAEAGIRTITIVVDSSRTEMGGGMPSPMAGGDWFKGTTTIRRVNDDGDVLSSTTVPGPNLPPMMAGRTTDFGGTPGRGTFPKHPLRVGETWTDTVTQAAPQGEARPARTVVTTFKLERVELRDGSQVATVSVNGGVSVPADSARAASVSGDYTGEIVLDLTHRRMLRMLNETRMHVNSPTGPQTIYGRMIMSLVEP